MANNNKKQTNNRALHLKFKSVPAANPSNEKFGLMDIGIAALRLIPSARTILQASVKLYDLTPDSKQSIGKILEKQALDQPESPCLFFEEQVWNYRDFNAWRQGPQVSDAGLSD